MLRNIILLSLSVGTLIIGIHQAMVTGITESYWIFMFAVFFILAYRYFNNKDKEKEDKEPAVKAKDLKSNPDDVSSEGKLARKMRRRRKG